MEQGRIGATLDRVVTGLEQASGLDQPADAIGGIVQQATSSDRVKNLLSGAALGHALHPMMTDLPIGFWNSALLLDLVGGHDSGEDLMLLAGGVSALGAAATGLSDWSDSVGGARRTGMAHALLNVTALTLCTGALVARRAGARGTGRFLLLSGSAVATVSAYLGGHLVYKRGLGVTHAGFENDETISDWNDAAADSDVHDNQPLRVDVNGVPVMLVRNSGGLRAFVAACNHAGGPLDEGEFADGAVTCPWHGSRFSLEDGTVLRGPAAQPQPMLETRVRDGRVEVRAG